MPKKNENKLIKALPKNKAPMVESPLPDGVVNIPTAEENILALTVREHETLQILLAIADAAHESDGNDLRWKPIRDRIEKLLQN